jgi:CDGSH-type Zn-finger protein
MPAESTAPTPGPEPLALPAGVHQLCSCGRSGHGWFCDGAHLGSGRVSYELRRSEPATVLVCARDLALMACTLANGGQHPHSGARVMVTAGH